MLSTGLLYAPPNPSSSAANVTITLDADEGSRTLTLHTDEGSALLMAGSYDRAIAISDDVINRYAEATEPALQAELAKALDVKADALRKLGRSDKALAVSDEVVGRFGQASAPLLQEQVGRALLNKGAQLDALPK